MYRHVAPDRLVLEYTIDACNGLHQEVSADNNLAERSLCPFVIARRVSGGTRRSVFPSFAKFPFLKAELLL